MVYVQDTAAQDVAGLAEQATDAILAIKKLVDTATEAGTEVDPDALTHQKRLLKSALVLAQNATSGRSTKLERKYNALFNRLTRRWEDYLRYTHDRQVPFDNNPAEQTIRMPKLRIKVSGSLRSMDGAQDFAAIRSYIATAARHGQNILHVLVQAATGTCWIPGTT